MSRDCLEVGWQLGILFSFEDVWPFPLFLKMVVVVICWVNHGCLVKSFQRVLLWLFVVMIW